MPITYLFDPLCGWCYGATPAMSALSKMDGVALELAPTGLFAGANARVMDAAFATYAWENDQRIARLTGQEFSDAYRSRVLGDVGAMFDSAPATLGVVAVALTEREQEVNALIALQRARYVDGRDNSELSVVSSILSTQGFKKAARWVLSPDEDLMTAYRSRIDASRLAMTQLGARGVPALAVEGANGRRLLPNDILFGNIEALVSELEAA